LIPSYWWRRYRDSGFRWVRRGTSSFSWGCFLCCHVLRATRYFRYQHSIWCTFFKN